MEENEEKTKSPVSRDSSEGFFERFRKYVNGWVAAALVLPTAVTWKGMPVYESQRGLLLTYTTLSCALLLAFLFTGRGLITGIAQAKSGRGKIGSLLVPLILIVATVSCGYEYWQALLASAQYQPGKLTESLKTLEMNQIHDGTSIMAYYILIMAFAESAFFFMAIRESEPTSL